MGNPEPIFSPGTHRTSSSSEGPAVQTHFSNSSQSWHVHMEQKSTPIQGPLAPRRNPFHTDRDFSTTVQNILIESQHKLTQTHQCHFVAVLMCYFPIARCIVLSKTGCDCLYPVAIATTNDAIVSEPASPITFCPATPYSHRG